MNQPEQKEFFLNSMEIIMQLYRYKKLLLIIFIVTLVGSVFFTSPLFITPLFKSTAVIYPVNPGSVSGVLLGETQGQDVLGFGDEQESERLLQLLNSTLIRDHVISKYNLLSHYQIDTTKKYAKTKLYKEFEQKFNFSRTEFMAVQIKVMDRDPVLAAEMANDIVKLIDTVKTNIQKERAIEGLKIIEAEYERSKSEVARMEDSLNYLRGKGVLDYELQTEMINRQLAIELGEGNQAAVNRLEKELNNLAEFGGAYLSLNQALVFERQRLSNLKAKYEGAKVDVTKQLPQTFVISNAYIAEKKSYPPRMLIVLSVTVSVMLFSFILILFFEKISKHGSFVVK